MKAAVCRAHGAPLTIEDIDIAAPAADQVEVTMKAVAICHSDISYADGAWGGSLPAVYGHEAAGIVSAVGPGVAGLAPGDSVVVTLIRACGTCPSCASGKPTVCETPYDGDKGPNTGGMGAYAPAPVLSDAVAQRALDEIVQPTIDEMARRGTPYQGVLYVGLMIQDGAPRLVEYNVRFGDPECQVLMMRLGAQALDLLQAAAEERLAVYPSDLAAHWFLAIGHMKLKRLAAALTAFSTIKEIDPVWQQDIVDAYIDGIRASMSGPKGRNSQ